MFESLPTWEIICSLGAIFTSFVVVRYALSRRYRLSVHSWWYDDNDKEKRKSTDIVGEFFAFSWVAGTAFTGLITGLWYLLAWVYTTEYLLPKILTTALVLFLSAWILGAFLEKKSQGLKDLAETNL